MISAENDSRCISARSFAISNTSNTVSSARTGRKGEDILRGFNVKLSGFRGTEYGKLKLILQRLGGSCIERSIDEVYTSVVSSLTEFQSSSRSLPSSSSYPSRLDCLICKSVGGKDYIAAKRREIPTVTTKWLHDCYHSQSALPFTEYICPPFHGLVVVSTQIEEIEREKYKQLVEKNGGEFQYDLVHGQCTHLLCKKAEGKKYVYASNWGNVKLINLKWVTDCVSAKSKY